MRRFGTMVILLGLLAVVLVGCGLGQTPIPAGVQQVHVVITESEARLDPATVRAGDVWVVLDTPESSYSFVSRKRGAVEIGPLSDDDLARLAHGGDAQGFGFGGFDYIGCSAEQRAEGRGKMGPPCGNAIKMVLVEGKYAFLIGNIEEGPPQSIAVLEVLP